MKPCVVPHNGIVSNSGDLGLLCWCRSQCMSLSPYTTHYWTFVWMYLSAEALITHIHGIICPFLAIRGGFIIHWLKEMAAILCIVVSLPVGVACSTDCMFCESLSIPGAVFIERCNWGPSRIRYAVWVCKRVGMSVRACACLCMQAAFSFFPPSIWILIWFW